MNLVACCLTQLDSSLCIGNFFFYTTPNHGVLASKNIRKTKANRLHNFKKTIQQEGLATETFLNMADSAGEYLMQSSERA